MTYVVASFTVGSETYPQSMAIVRHLGRQHGLYGTSAHEAVWIDAILDGADDLRRPWGMAMYIDLMKPEGLSKYWETRCDPANITGFNAGGHFEFLSRVYKRTRGSQGYCIGEALTIAGKPCP